MGPSSPRAKKRQSGPTFLHLGIFTRAKSWQISEAMLRSCLLIMGVWFLSGCHVVERAEQCRALAERVNASEKLLSSSKLGDDPLPEDLRARADHYGLLAVALEKIAISDHDVKTERQTAVAQLLSLKKELQIAAEAVEGHEEAEKKAEEAKKERELAQKALAPRNSETGEDPKMAKPHRAVQGLIGTPSSPPSVRYNQYVRQYTQARRVAESSGQNLEGTLDRIERACR